MRHRLPFNPKKALKALYLADRGRFAWYRDENTDWCFVVKESSEILTLRTSTEGDFWRVFGCLINQTNLHQTDADQTTPHLHSGFGLYLDKYSCMLEAVLWALVDVSTKTAKKRTYRKKWETRSSPPLQNLNPLTPEMLSDGVCHKFDCQTDGCSYSPCYNGRR